MTQNGSGVYVVQMTGLLDQHPPGLLDTQEAHKHTAGKQAHTYTYTQKCLHISVTL